MTRNPCASGELAYFQAGFILPSTHEATSDVLAKAEKERVDANLRKYARPREAYTPTQPVAPRLGVFDVRSHRTIVDGTQPTLRAVLLLSQHPL